MGINVDVRGLQETIFNGTIMDSGYSFLASSNLTVSSDSRIRAKAKALLSSPNLAKIVGDRCIEVSSMELKGANRSEHHWLVRTAAVNVTKLSSFGDCHSPGLRPFSFDVITASSIDDAFALAHHINQGGIVAGCTTLLSALFFLVVRTYYILKDGTSSLADKIVEDTQELSAFLDRCIKKDFHPDMGNGLNPDGFHCAETKMVARSLKQMANILAFLHVKITPRNFENAEQIFRSAMVDFQANDNKRGVASELRTQTITESLNVFAS